MKRAFATFGVVGLAMLSVTAPAYAANDVKVCHNGAVIWVNSHAVDGPNDHAGHATDIISPEDLAPLGLNWTLEGIETYNHNCVPKVVLPPGEEEEPPGEEEQPPAEEEQPPGEEEQPPAEEEEAPTTEVEQSTPLTEIPVTLTPAAQTPAPQVAAPKGAAATAPAAKAPAAVSQGTNQGFNAQTSVGGAESAPTWLAGLGLMLGAGALVAVRRRSTEAKAD